MEYIASLNAPQRVEATGFSMVDSSSHMIALLGRGEDFRHFLTNDVESELYVQTPGAQLLSITCKETPTIKSRAVQTDPGGRAILADVSVTFPLALLIKMADRSLWHLDVEHGYDAVNVHMNDGRRTLTQNFKVINHRRVS
ncbi:hypothetical protein [Ponticaulis koreensis]|uniref:hypothetical protein n=1 Tax=Ponticaulis koreensis TaxID=1123045 RepID=UPI0012DCCE9D|nr:hypothetical protein [Ponticaulis koreensis]